MIQRARWLLLVALLILAVAVPSGPPVSAQGTITGPTVSSAIVAAGTSITLPAPAGVTASSVVVASIAAYESDTVAVSAPAGWQSQGCAISSTAARLYRQCIYVYAGVPGSYVFSSSENRYLTGIALAYGGVSLTNPVDVAASHASGSSAARIAGSVTTVTANARLIMLSAGWDTVPAAPAGMTQRASIDGDVTRVWDEPRAAIGATGTRSAAQTAGAWTVSMLALRPAAATPTSTPTSTATNTATRTPTSTAAPIACPSGYALFSTLTVSDVPQTVALPVDVALVAQSGTVPVLVRFGYPVYEPIGQIDTLGGVLYLAQAGGPITPTEVYVAVGSASVLYCRYDGVMPTNTATSTATSTATATNTATRTTTPTNTATSTATPINTATSTATPINTATSTATPINTATSTATPINTATSTATPINTTMTPTATGVPATSTPFLLLLPLLRT